MNVRDEVKATGFVYDWFCSTVPKLAGRARLQLRMKLKNILFIAIVTLPSCNHYFSQRPAEIYANELNPPLAEQLANPRPTEEQLRTILSLDKRGTLPFLSIDSGFDPYSSPLLLRQTDWMIEGNEVVGFGTDIMGDDNFPYPAIVDHSLFAFGARALDARGRIVDPVEDPLKLLDKINADFASEFVTRLNESEQLRDTYFAKITEANFSIIAAYLTILYNEANPFDRRAYDIELENGGRIEPVSVSMKRYHSEVGELGEKGKVADVMIQHHVNWNGMDVYGFPVVEFLGNRSKIRHDSSQQVYGFPEFFRILSESFENIDQRHDFRGAVDTYVKFLRSRRAFLPRDDQDVDISAPLKRLQADWYKLHSGFAMADPFRHILYSSAQALGDVAWHDYFVGDRPFESLKQDARSHFGQQYDRLAAIYKTISEHPDASRTDRKQASASLEKIETAKSRVLSYIESRGFDDFDRLFDPDFAVKPLLGGEEFSKVGALQQNPYLAGSSWKNPLGAAAGAQAVDAPNRSQPPIGETSLNPFVDGLIQSSTSNSHGTQTAALVLAQDPRFRVHPVRAMTDMQYSTRRFRELLSGRYFQYFNDWLKNLAVLQGVADLLEPFLGLPFSVNDVQKLSASQIRHLKTEIRAIFKDQLIKLVDSNQTLSLMFFEDLRDSVKVAGQRKIPFGNISLGDNFAQPSAVLNQEDQQRQLDNSVKFLEYEMFKYLMSETMLKDAPGTTFFVSAGNSNSWLDAETRSSLPAVIYSSYFAKYEQRGLGKILNNHVENILVIGSLQNNGENLAEHTNVVFRKGLPFALSVGENVESVLQYADRSGAELAFEIAYPRVLSRWSFKHLPTDDLVAGLESEGLSPERWLSKTKTEKKREVTGLLEDFERDNRMILSAQFCADSPVCTKPAGGTSFASPLALGVAMKGFVSWLDSQGIVWSDDLYNKKGYTPKELIAWAIENTTEPANPNLVLEARRFLNFKPIPPQEKTPFVNYESGQLVCKELLWNKR